MPWHLNWGAWILFTCDSTMALFDNYKVENLLDLLGSIKRKILKIIRPYNMYWIHRRLVIKCSLKLLNTSCLKYKVGIKIDWRIKLTEHSTELANDVHACEDRGANINIDSPKIRYCSQSLIFSTLRPFKN